MGSYYDEDVLEVREISTFERQEVFQTFLKSGSPAILNGSESCAYVAVTIQFQDGGKGRFLSRNSTGGDHAEVKMADYLKEAIGHRSLSRKQTLVAYMNFSPCHDCSRELCSLKRDHLDRMDIELELVVAHLYKMDEDRNRRGLRDLDNQGVVLRAFHSSGKQDWNTLSHSLLEVGGYKYSQDIDRRLADEHVEQNLAEILEEDEEDAYWQPSQNGWNTAYFNGGNTDIFLELQPVKTSQPLKNGATHSTRESFVLSMPEEEQPAQKETWFSFCSIL